MPWTSVPIKYHFVDLTKASDLSSRRGQIKQEIRFVIPTPFLIITNSSLHQLFVWLFIFAFFPSTAAELYIQNTSQKVSTYTPEVVQLYQTLRVKN